MIPIPHPLDSLFFGLVCYEQAKTQTNNSAERQGDLFGTEDWDDLPALNIRRLEPDIVFMHASSSKPG